MTSATAVDCFARGTMREMMECTAGKATPSPSPSATRASSSCGAPARAAAGVRKVASDQAPRPAARTGLPPRRSAICPPCWRAHSRRGRASARVQRVQTVVCVCACQHLRGSVADEEAGEHPPANGRPRGAVASARQAGAPARRRARSGGAPLERLAPPELGRHAQHSRADVRAVGVCVCEREGVCVVKFWRTGATLGAPHTR